MANKEYNLSKISTRAPKNLDKQDTKKKTEKLSEKLSELQNLLFAESKRSVLIVLQGMDASGKDGVIREVFDGVNPLGCRVQAFKAPSEEERAHDFLWRIHQHTPAKGMIQIFNRSHYEDVLVPRIKGWISQEQARRRFRYIHSFEQCLQDEGTVILKFFLYVSKKEQMERFQERLTDPRKKWKYNDEDLKTSEQWDEYMSAYEDIFKNCSEEIPWTIVPSDQNWYKEYLVAKKIVETLEKLDMKYPSFGQ